MAETTLSCKGEGTRLAVPAGSVSSLGKKIQVGKPSKFPPFRKYLAKMAPVTILGGWLLVTVGQWGVVWFSVWILIASHLK